MYGRLLVSLAALAVFALSGWSAPIVQNSSFEAVQISSPFSSANPADIPNWTKSGALGDGLLWAIGYVDSGGSITVAGDGNQFVTMGGGSNASANGTLVSEY